MGYTMNQKWYDKENLQPKVWNQVKPDGWKFAGTLVSCSWDKAEFRLQSGVYADVATAVNVELSERSNLVYVSGSTSKVRVKITFVGDCEPDVVVHGFMTVLGR